MSTDRFDFHLHSRCSDGSRTPQELLELAREAGLSGISITDHDTADAYAELERIATPGGPRLLPGIEVSAARGGSEIHILGYFPSGIPAGISSLVNRLLTMRSRRIREGIERLRVRGIALEWADVQAEARGRVVSRGHLAQALVKKRLVPNISAAFPDLLGPEMVHPPEADAGEVVGEISRLGGIAVWAHPAPGLLDCFLDELVGAGLTGIELHTPRRRWSERKQVEARIAGRGLMVSGGSDWHGYPGGDPLGSFAVLQSQVGEFLGAIGWGR